MGNGHRNDGYRHNHYVPEWYQKRFLAPGNSKHWYLDLKPDVLCNSDATWTRRSLLHWGPQRCFAQDDLYTMRWGNIENKEIEKFFFGDLDRKGKYAVEYFSNFTWPSASGENLNDLLRYMSAQKMRTPKGLGCLNGWVRLNNQNLSMVYLQRRHMMFCAIWMECVWQIADASQSPTKLIISDHPVTVYNRECFPGSALCRGFNDPDIIRVATHTYFPLSLDKILILTNLSWVRDPYQSAIAARPNPDFFRGAVFNFEDIQTKRMLSEQEVIEINFITKRRAWRYIAAAEKDWLYPELNMRSDHWRKLGNGYLFMPEPRHIYMGGRVIFGGFDDGRPSEAFSEYGHRPWQEGYESAERNSRESRSLERFKAEWAALHGPAYRGISSRFGASSRPTLIAESLESHERHLARDAETRRRPGERQRRRRLMR